jgi:phage shock protein A
MEKRPEDLGGMNAADAREYILHHITALKLTEKNIRELDEDLARWNSRIDAARSRGREDLAAEAEQAAGDIRGRQARLAEEAAGLGRQIEEMRKQLPALAARERSVDPDLLEQELLMAAGRLPGDEEKTRTEQQFQELEKTAAADAALEELKAKMERDRNQ